MIREQDKPDPFTHPEAYEAQRLGVQLGRVKAQCAGLAELVREILEDDLVLLKHSWKERARELLNRKY